MSGRLFVSAVNDGGSALLNIGSKPLFAATGSPSVGDLTRPRPGNDNCQATAAHPLAIESGVDLSGQIHRVQQQSSYQLTSPKSPFRGQGLMSGHRYPFDPDDLLWLAPAGLGLATLIIGNRGEPRVGA